MLYVCFLFFFFQAEDGIRDLTVTGVQTCALPICLPMRPGILVLLEAVAQLWAAEDLYVALVGRVACFTAGGAQCSGTQRDRKSTRLNSSHSQISYAVFCLKKKNSTTRIIYC